MSYSYYLVDNEDKILICCYNKSKESIIHDFSLYEEFMNFGQQYNEIIETPLVKLSINELNIILSMYEHSINFFNIITNKFACEYWYRYNKEKKLKLIGEEDLSKFKDYTIIY